ncbi:hypothetical protein BP6252_06429 [Coleophoma cylindrospora]|uniref:GED domain-containing protein n=1 Tax=Coleophoma cylindrospora TaxID=1849047 RepID=A0A3D8RMK0_9HELO|nr:hypothetical protein BP6252_06429 [Coleophoma cylindrospora]
MPPRRFKQERERQPTVPAHGIPTPESSMSNPSAATSFASQATHPVFLDEGYETLEHTRRSMSPSVTSSAAPRKLHHKKSSDMMMDHNLPEAEPESHVEVEAGLQIVGSKVKILVDAISKLRQFDLGHVVQLPELVLVGDQSSGKSSLMSALAEINLPRKSGTCTRCPANIKTSTADSWKCSVSLMQTWDYTPQSKRKPFPGWSPQPLVTKPFKTISSKIELEEVITWAQLALRNHKTDYKAFIPGSGHLAQRGEDYLADSPAEYSPNVIMIEIEGPNLPSLSFYDLPGIFQAAKTEELNYLVDVFLGMSTNYIKRPNAQIICAMPMHIDPGNTLAAKVVSQLGANKSRCIGVLTMPDRMQANGKYDDWEEVLKGQAHRLPHGYFVTKQPGPDSALNQNDPQYHQLARREEENYFDNDALWSDRWSRFRDRCGTKAIQNYVAQVFATQIAQSIPDITKKIEKESENIETALSDLPNTLNSNVQHIVRKVLGDFSNRVTRIFEKDSEFVFLHEWSSLTKDFRETILALKPKINFTHASDAFPEVIHIIDDSDDEDTAEASPVAMRPQKRANENDTTPAPNKRPRYNVTPTPSTLNGHAIPNTPLRVPKQEENLQVPFTQRRRIMPAREPNRLLQSVFAEFIQQNPGQNFASIGDIRDRIEQSRFPGQPDNVSYRVKEEYCLQSVYYWERPMETLMTTAFSSLRKKIHEVLKEALKGYNETELYRRSRDALDDFLDKHEASQREKIQQIFELESDMVYTINEPAFNINKARELAILQKARRERRARMWVDKENANKKALTKEQMTQAIKRVTDEQLGIDPFKEEMDLAGYLRGYYVTAGLRFADNVCQNIQGNLFNKIKGSIRDLLEGLLDLNKDGSEETCRMLLAEDSGVVLRRRNLSEQKEKLRGFSEELNLLKAQYYAPIEEPTEAPAAMNGNYSHQNADTVGEEEDPHGYL